jgi:hypothetical protein
LWDQLQDVAGLKPDTYDSHLVEEIALLMGAPDAKNLAAHLVATNAPAQQLLDGVILALEPYSRMLKDLLDLYEWAGATSGCGDNLRIVYDFSERDEAVDLDLTHFREAVETWHQGVIPRSSSRDKCQAVMDPRKSSAELE